MTSLDKLAKMDGWDIGEDDTDGAIGVIASPATAEQQQSLGDDVGSRLEIRTGNDDRQPRDLDGEAQRKTLTSLSDPRNEPGEPGDLNVDVSTSRSSGTSRSPVGLGLTCQESVRTVITDGQSSSSGGGSTSDKLLSTYPSAIESTNPTRAESAMPTPQQAWSTPRLHPLDTLRKKCFGGECGSRSVGAIAGESGTAEEIAKLRLLLKRAQEDTAREMERREECEEQAREAYATMEAESKRAGELDSRVRVAEMALSMSTGNNHNGTRAGGPGGGGGFRNDGGISGGVSSKINSWERKARSLSPVRNRGREIDNAETVETQAQIAVLADVTNVAREEAQSALDTVEGFATLNRKLMDELRAAVSARDDLFNDLRVERGLREQLEEDFGEVLEKGFVAEFARKQEELEARCTREQEETARVVAVHARMEEEYRLALSSADQERGRLEEAIASLEARLADERRAQAIRAKEEAERAAMGSEEVLSVRAGLQPRAKRRGRDSVHLRQSSRIVVAHEGGNGVSTGDRWRGAVRGRTAERQVQRNPPGRAPIQHPSSTSHNGLEPRNRRSIQRHQRSVSSAVAIAALGRPADNNHAGRPGGGGGGSSVGVGGVYGGGDGSVGHAVQAAAVVSVEVFLGDFVPKVEQPPEVATLLATGAEKKGAGEGGTTGVDGVVAKKVSKWAAIGRGGKISARATAVCIEEATKAAEATALSRLRSLTNASARSLSASWFCLLTRATTGATAHGNHGHGHGHDGPGNDHTGSGSDGVASVDSTVPVVVVRRLVQSCGILQGTAGGPTLAHADMELQRHAAGKRARSIGHREYFKVMLALAQYRFAGEPKDEALEKLSRILRPTQAGPGTVPHPHSRQMQIHVATLAAKPAPPGGAEATPDAMASADAAGGAGGEEELNGAERVLERDRRALEIMFSHYAASSLLPFAALASFCKDFELTPGLISRDDAHRIYVQLAYPNETLLTPKLLAAREGPRGRRAAAAARSGGEGAAPAAGFGLSLGQWITWLGLAAVGCTWFDKQRGLYNTPTKKVLGLLQWMEGSVGKKTISSKRGAAIVPAFNLKPLKVTPR